MGKSPYTFTHWAFCLSLQLGARAQWFQLRSELEARDRGDSLLFSNDPKGSFRCMNHLQSTHHSAFDKTVELHRWTCGDKVIRYDRDSNLGSFHPGLNILYHDLTMDLLMKWWRPVLITISDRATSFVMTFWSEAFTIYVDLSIILFPHNRTRPVDGARNYSIDWSRAWTWSVCNILYNKCLNLRINLHFAQ
jgi:hypothetical protein